MKKLNQQPETNLTFAVKEEKTPFKKLSKYYGVKNQTICLFLLDKYPQQMKAVLVNPDKVVKFSKILDKINDKAYELTIDKVIHQKVPYQEARIEKIEYITNHAIIKLLDLTKKMVI